MSHSGGAGSPRAGRPRRDPRGVWPGVEVRARRLARAAGALCAAAVVLSALAACSVDERPADQRPHVALSPVPDPSTSQVPPTPADPRSGNSASQSG